jgi:hypothetical protein
MSPIVKITELPRGMSQRLVDLIQPEHWEKLTGRQKIFAPHRETKAIFIRSVPDPAAKQDYDMNFGPGFMIDHEFRSLYAPAFDPIMEELEKIMTVEEWAATAILLPAGCSVKKHKDVYPNPPNLHRLHIPLQTNDRTHFYCGNSRINMKVDTVYEVFNIDNIHWVDNFGDTDRIHLVIDVMGIYYEE